MENAPPIPHDDSEPTRVHAPPAGYETSDAPLRPILIFVIALALSALAIHTGVWFQMRHHQHRNAAADPTPSPFANDRTPPPEPRLQPSVAHPRLPQQDLVLLQNRWQEELNASGPVPGDPGRVRIPIDRAISLLVDRGLPAPTTRPASKPSTTPAGGGK